MKKWMLPLIASLSINLMIGCTTPYRKQIKKVSVNMDKGDVLELMGSPLRTLRRSGKDHWIYRYPVNGNLEATKIIFEQGYVVEIKKHSLRPHKLHAAMDSVSLKEYEQAIKERQQRQESQFVELDE